MDAKEQNESDIKLEIKPQRLKRMGLGFNEDEFLLVFGYDELKNKKKVEGQFAVTVSSEGLKKLIAGLFDSGKMYQEQFNKNIGFGDAEEE